MQSYPKASLLSEDILCTQDPDGQLGELLREIITASIYVIREQYGKRFDLTLNPQPHDSELPATSSPPQFISLTNLTGPEQIITYEALPSLYDLNGLLKSVCTGTTPLASKLTEEIIKKFRDTCTKLLPFLIEYNHITATHAKSLKACDDNVFFFMSFAKHLLPREEIWDNELYKGMFTKGSIDSTETLQEFIIKSIAENLNEINPSIKALLEIRISQREELYGSDIKINCITSLKGIQNALHELLSSKTYKEVLNSMNTPSTECTRDIGQTIYGFYALFQNTTHYLNAEFIAKYNLYTADPTPEKPSWDNVDFNRFITPATPKYLGHCLYFFIGFKRNLEKHLNCLTFIKELEKQENANVTGYDLSSVGLGSAVNRIFSGVNANVIGHDLSSARIGSVVNTIISDLFRVANQGMISNLFAQTGDDQNEQDPGEEHPLIEKDINDINDIKDIYDLV